MKIHIITADTLMDMEELGVEFTVLGVYTNSKKAKNKYEEAKEKFASVKLITVRANKNDCLEKIGSYHE